jgi:hypothetical protein
LAEALEGQEAVELVDQIVLIPLAQLVLLLLDKLTPAVVVLAAITTARVLVQMMV